jgi:tetratricopeptide (TPR) repeat protein
VFVLTEDSTSEGSVCKDEWTWALKYKKPVIPIRLHTKGELPFRLGSRQFIDFVSNFEAGIAKLRKHFTYLDSAKGILDELKHRHADATRDLRRARPDDQPRIKAELDELTEQIKRQEEIVRNPKAAEEKTEKNIQSGLERERQPEKPVAGKTSTRFINPPPGIAPNYFQDRLIETKQITDFLNNDSQRLMTVVGRAGVGKTAMVCRLLKALERGELPDDLGEMKVDGIVYLSETGSHRVNFANVFADLSKLLPASGETAERLEGIYKNPQTSTGDKMRALLDAFPSGRVILLLDNFETLIDPESLSLRDSELSEALNALLGGQHHAVKAVITTRIAPRDLAISEPGRQHHLSLDEGLESPYAENVLREMDADGRVGLKSAPDALLNKAREKTRGYPRALEALYAILSVDRYTTLEELLELSLPDEVVQKLVGEAFNRLDPSAQKVMQALAVYNRPVSPAAIDYLLQPHLPSIDSALVLNRLVNMHFARREAGRYYLHPADKEYAFSIIPEKDLTTKDTKVTKEEQGDSSELPITNYQSPFTQHDLLNRAADYFAQARKPRAEWKKLDDLSAQLAEFELRCEAGDYDTAASVLTDIDFDYLLLWGHYRLMIDLHLRVKNKITDKYLRMGNLNGLGLAHNYIGKVKESIDFYLLGLDVSHEVKNRDWDGVFLGNLGNAHLSLGYASKAVEFYEQALDITREIGNHTGEGNHLGNLGNAYADMGNARKAIEFYEQALVIAREIGNRRNESAWLGNLGNRYTDLGDAYKSIEYSEQSLFIKQEIGDRLGESIKLENIGHGWLSLQEYKKAEENYQQAIQIADEISFPTEQLSARWGLSQAYLFQNELVNARATVEAALQYDMPQYNHNATTLHGIIALRQGERETAQEAFAKSIAQADEILAKTPDYYSALDAKGLALCGLVLTTGDSQLKADCHLQAIETFSAARKIAPHAGVVKSVLRLFDELVKCDGEGLLKGVREVIEGKPLVE